MDDIGKRMKVFRCLICGEPYLGVQKPTNCPCCGSLAKHIVNATEYRRLEAGELSEATKKNLEKARDIMIRNAEFYICSAYPMDAPESEALLLALARTEHKHANLVSDILGMHHPHIEYNPRTCHPIYLKNLEEAHLRGRSSLAFYKEIARNATDERVRQLFDALVEAIDNQVDLQTVLA
jgi:rubrerythrin